MMNFQNNPQFMQMNQNYNQFANQQLNWNMCMPMFYPCMNPNMCQNMMIMNNMKNMSNNFCMNTPMMQNNFNMMNNNMNNLYFNNAQNNNPNFIWNNFNMVNNQNLNKSANNINCNMINLIQGMNNINLDNNNVNILNRRTTSLLSMDYDELLKEIELINKTNIFFDNNSNKNKNKNQEINSREKILSEKEYQKLINEIKLIKAKIELIFSSENLSKLIDQKELLNFFYLKEKECIQYINDNFDKKSLLKAIVINEIKNIFYRNPQIHNISEKVIQKLREISNENNQSLDEFSAKISINFPGIEIPNFLMEYYMKNLECLLFLDQRNRETQTLINQIRNRNIINDSQKLILFLDNIRQNNNLIFEGFNCQLELLIFFIAINYDVFTKRYYNGEFFEILELNENIIKKYFKQCYEYKNVYKDFKSMNKTKRNEKIEELYSIIKMDINNKKDLMFNLIVSFYYLLFYLFKSSKFSNNESNLGNPFINLILKNFVIFLDQKNNNEIMVETNFYELLKDLYISDVSYLIDVKNFYPSKNKEYSFYDIDNILLNNDRVKIFYIKLKDKFTESGHFSKYSIGPGRNFTTFEKFIELIPLITNVFSNNIVIIIDGFLNEESNPLVKWKDFINYYKKEAIFYYYRWPSDTLINYLYNAIPLIWKFSSQFKNANVRAKIAGKILAYIIYSNTVFKNFQINLVAFSLGNHVIKHCIKELYKLNYNMKNIDKTIILSKPENNYPIYIKSIIFCAAATYFKNIKSWIKYKQEIIIDKFKNCYSGEDWILGFFYVLCMLRFAIGKYKLTINYQGKNLVDNYDFTKYNFGHRSYDMKILAKKIAGAYKEI